MNPLIMLSAVLVSIAINALIVYYREQKTKAEAKALD